MARVRFPYVVADLDNAFGAEQVEALWQSDVILLVLRLDYTSVRNTRRVLDNLAELGVWAWSGCGWSSTAMGSASNCESAKPRRRWG